MPPAGVVQSLLLRGRGLMRRLITLLMPVLVFAAAAAQQQSSANVQCVQRHLPFGLQGRVHTLLMKTEQVNKDPRPLSRPIEGSQRRWTLPRLQPAGFSPTWLSLDENGRPVEQGTVSPDG